MLRFSRVRISFSSLNAVNSKSQHYFDYAAFSCTYGGVARVLAQARTYSNTKKSAAKLINIGDINLELDKRKLCDVTIQYEEWGQVHDPQAPVVVVVPSLSMGSHARSSIHDPTHGWWENVIGAQRGIDLDRFRVICCSHIGAPFGSTNSLSKDKNGKVYMSNFPVLTPRDLAYSLSCVLGQLNIVHVYAVVGASLGGCVALQFAADYPDYVDRLCAVACTGKSTPGSVALRHVQREAIRNDPSFHGGEYATHGELPLVGMAIARQLGMITYRSVEEFDAKFAWEGKEPHHWLSNTTYEVEQYLTKHGARFGPVFDANCYLTLSKCADLMDLGRGYKSFAEGVQRIRAKTKLIGVREDIITPSEQLESLHHILSALGHDSSVDVYSSPRGHDSFLTDFEYFVPTIRDFLH